MRYAFMILIIVAASLLISPCANSQDNLKILRAEGFPSLQRSPVRFAHDAHNEKAGINNCQECHHVYADGKRVLDESSEGQQCSECHGLSDSGRQPGLMKAYHMNCKGCHQTQEKGPIMCGECHSRGVSR